MTDNTIGKTKVDIVDTKPTSVTLSIEIPKDEVASETEKVFKDIQRVAQVPGFRQGKAPLDLIKKNYVKAAQEKVIEQLIQRTAYESLKSKGVEPIAAPRVEDVSFDFEKPFSYKLRAERHPEFKVKDYKGIKIQKEIREITDQKVKENIETLRERNARLETSDSDTVADKDFILVDYEGSLNGEPVADLKSKNQLIDLSAPQALAGFKEGLVGAKKGGEKDITVKFPADHPNKKLAGNDVVFKVKVQEIKRKVLPPLDDELAKDLGIENLAALEAKVRETLQAEEKRRQDTEVEKQVIDHLLAANVFPVPESLVEEQLNHMLDRAAEYYRRQGLPDAAWEKNLPQWREKYRQESERNVRTSYLLNAVGKDEKIETTDSDLNGELESLKKANPGKEADVEKYFAERRNDIAPRIREEKIFKFLLDNAKIKEEKK